MNGRIEREYEPISVTEGRDGGASWADAMDQRRGMRELPGIWQSSRQAAETLGAWACFAWFIAILIRAGSVGAGELAGFALAVAGLVLVTRRAG